MLSVLLITESPDLRHSTRDLELAAQALRRRPDVRVGLWYLRHGDRDPVGHSWVVDDLRTWRPAATLDRLGARLPANLIRGLRLRRRLRVLDPDVVVLDDGLGARVLNESNRQLLLTRRNAVGPSSDSLEPPVLRSDAILDSDPWRPPPERVPSLEMGPLRDHAGSNSVNAMRVGRRALGLPEDVDVVVAPASASNPELLIGVLRACKNGGRRRVHGLWVDPHCSPSECSAARERASLGGVSDVFHLRQVDLVEALPVADIVLMDRESADAHCREGLEPSIVLPYCVKGVGAAGMDSALNERVVQRLSNLERNPRSSQGRNANAWVERFMTFVGELARSR